MSKIASIVRVGLVSVLAIIIVIAAVGVYVYTDTSQMSTAKTTSRSTVTTISYSTTYTTPFIITNTSMSNNTQTVVSNHTVTTTVPSDINSTTISSVVSSETPCTPSRYYDSTMTLSEQSTTTTEQVYYDGTTCDFGNSLFEPPSAILISTGTLVWTNFQLQENGSYSVSGSISFLAFPDIIGANIKVAVYYNGHLNGSSITPVTQLGDEATNSSLIPSSNSSNSIFALRGMTPTVGVSGEGGRVNLNGTTITIAFVSDKPLWLCGYTQADMSRGTQFGQSIGQLNGTYEWPDSELSLPNSLPQPTTTLSFELQISGNYAA